MTEPALLVAERLGRSYGEPGAQTRALDDVDLTFQAHRLHAVTGPSGSGKSTLLQLLAGLDRPSSGRVLLDGADLGQLSRRRLARLRQRETGIVFQRFNLIPSLTAADNIRLPQVLAGRQVDPDWYAELVEVLGLGRRLQHRPSQLSGGQQQRVAVGRALLGRPRLCFADEPTGSLDREAGDELIDLLRRITHEYGLTTIAVTHDERLVARADCVVRLVDGRAEPLNAPG